MSKVFLLGIISLFLVSCQENKHREFFCITPLGLFHSDSDNEKLTRDNNHLFIDNEDSTKTLVINRASCLEEVDK